MNIFPDYHNNIINVSASLSAYLGMDTPYPRLKLLSAALNKKAYKNVVLIVFDALGYHVLKRHLDRADFLLQNVRSRITSVFPSTTTNATATLMSLSYPGEHCWLGWSLYFSEIAAPVDVFIKKMSGRDEPAPAGLIESAIPYECFYNHANSAYISVYTVFPEIVDRGHSKNHILYDGLEEMFTCISALCQAPERKLVFAYAPEPDTTMHRYGVGSVTAAKIIREINDRTADFASKTGDDTLLVITADHGQIDITRHIELYQDQKLMGFLSRPLSLEGRATSFAIKPGQAEEFREYFHSAYPDCALYRADELIASGVFGPTMKDKGRDFLGDFIAVPADGAAFLLHGQAAPYLGNHGGLLPGEMEVPLIIWSK
jgi:hypothetical protein